jgi:site-specific recombinase XerD
MLSEPFLIGVLLLSILRCHEKVGEDMTETGADMRTITLEKGLATFLDALSGKNRSAATIRAYQMDILQFISFLHSNNVSIQTPADVEKVDIVEHLSALAKRELTGIARARKMSAIREYFRFLDNAVELRSIS